MSGDPYVCRFCLEEPPACDCDRSRGGGHWVPLSEARQPRRFHPRKPMRLVQYLLKMTRAVRMKI